MLTSGAFGLLQANSRWIPGDDGRLDKRIGEEDDAGMVPATEMTHSNDVKPGPRYVDLGPDAMVDVREIGLWIMGSRGPSNEYISCGSVSLG